MHGLKGFSERDRQLTETTKRHSPHSIIGILLALMIHQTVLLIDQLLVKMHRVAVYYPTKTEGHVTIPPQ